MTFSQRSSQPFLSFVPVCDFKTTFVIITVFFIEEFSLPVITCSKLTLKTPERRQWLVPTATPPCFSVSIVNFVQSNVGWVDIVLIYLIYEVLVDI